MDDGSLEQFRRKLAQRPSYCDREDWTRLDICHAGDMLSLEFYGDPADEEFEAFCEIVRQPKVAERVAALALMCPDEGTNGTVEWDLEQLLPDDGCFQNLRSFSVQQNSPSYHNRIIVGRQYDERGMLSRLLRCSPRLERLSAPSAPSEEFFDIHHPYLRLLNIDAGYDTQNFIANLAKSRAFPSITHLEFGEYHETYMDDFAQKCTPFADYVRLFESDAMKNLRSFVWRNPTCTDEQIEALRALRPRHQLAIKIVRFSARYC